MRTFIIALAASTALAGAAYAQTPPPTAPDQDQDSTVAPATGGASATDAAPAGEQPTAPDQDQDSTAIDAEDAAPTPGATDAPPVDGEEPTDPDQDQDATEIEVGGAPMYSDQPISVNAPTASNLSTLWSAVQAADLEATLEGEGPFTAFAPDNAAFEALPDGTLDELLEEGSRDELTEILTYHVVPSVLTSDELADGQSSELTTVQGGTLTIANAGGTVTVTDEQGNTATVTQADVLQSNGVVHVIDTVLMPAD